MKELESVALLVSLEGCCCHRNMIDEVEVVSMLESGRDGSVMSVVGTGEMAVVLLFSLMLLSSRRTTPPRTLTLATFPRAALDVGITSALAVALMPNSEADARTQTTSEQP